MSNVRTQRLIERVARRVFFGTVVRGFRDGVLLGCALLLALLLATRLGSLLPEPRFSWLASGLGICALLFAAVRARRSSAAETARLIDARAGTRELFLTAILTDDGTDGFQSIVHAQAEARAEEIEPRRVAPLSWKRGTGQSALALAAGVAAFQFLPHLDPLGKAAERRKIAEQDQRLQEWKKATSVRTEQLAQGTETDSEEIKQAIASLEKTFREAKPAEREMNLKRLSEEQRELGEMWRKISNELPRDAFDKAAQSFGQADAQKIRQMHDELKKGELSEVKKSLGEIREQLKKLAAMPDSAEKRALQQQLMRKLNAVADAVREAAGSSKAGEALARALQQLDQAKLGALSREAAQDALDSLNLSEQELEQLAQKMQDGQALEDALKSLQMARQLAEAEQLDGAECQNCDGMEDYAALFARKMAEAGLAGAGGTGMGPGQGNGARRPEDETAQSGFKSEKSTSALTNGKLLMQWKSSEVGETGARAEEYRERLHQVKQGVSEAITAEQVPPGYHAAIQKYFDALPVK